MLYEIINKFLHAFPAFKHRNYKLYFIGQLISQTGTWLQVVALSWLVLKLTHSAFQVGFVSALTTLPVLFLALFSGVIIDHFPKKSLLIFTQSASMFTAIILGILTVTGLINLYEIYILAFISGVILSLDSPTRQSFVIEMVGKESLSSAIAINSGIYNLARIAGPAMGGFIIAAFGEGVAFLINGISYLAVLIALIYIQVINVKHNLELNPIKSVIDGIIYVHKNTAIKTLVIFAVAGAIFGWAYTAILPYIVKNTFKMDATSLGFFYGSMGIGAVGGAIIVSIFRKINPVVFIFGGSILSGVSVIIFALTNNVFFAISLLFLSGLGLILQFSTINSVIQHIVDDKLRGRVMGIYSVTFVGMLPIGSILIGYLAEKINTSFSLILVSIIVLIFNFIFIQKRSVIYTEYTNSFSKN